MGDETAAAVVVQNDLAEMEKAEALLRTGLDSIRELENLEPLEKVEAVQPEKADEAETETEVKETNAEEVKEEAIAETETAKTPEIVPAVAEKPTGIDKGLQRTQKKLAAVDRKLSELLKRSETAPVAKAEVDAVANEQAEVQAELEKISAGTVDDPLKAMQILARSQKASSLRNKELEAELARTKAAVQAEKESDQAWSNFDKANPHLAGKGREKWTEFVASAEKRGYQGEAVRQRADEDWQAYLAQAVKPEHVTPSKTGKPLVNKQVVKPATQTVANPEKQPTEEDWMTMMKKDLL